MRDAKSFPDIAAWPDGNTSGNEKYPLIGVKRLCFETDGSGITTLVSGAFCPLDCKYCLNKKALESIAPEYVSVRELYDRVCIDNLYFQTTGGGLTFGGGESLIYSGFIASFRELIGEAWKLNAETSLYVSRRNLETALSCIDGFIVDVKDINPDIYKAYTGHSCGIMLENLLFLADNYDKKRVKIRIPLIPGFNTGDDCDRSENFIRSLGFENVDRFTYIVR